MSCWRPALPSDGGGYLEYMAERPRSHGLFSADGPANLEKTMEEINGHTGPVWTFVYSLKREDAHRLGYENSESWRRLLLAHQTELATAMKIPPSNFRWCAAFHDEKHHPHIHMMVWSADPKQGFLTEKGIEKCAPQLSNEVFRDELLSLYQQKRSVLQPSAGRGDGGHGAAHSGDGDRSVSQHGHRNADGDAGWDAGGSQGQKRSTAT